jgi:hypothetical protein
MYMCMHCLYQAGHVYVHTLPVPSRSCLYTYSWPVWYRQFIQIYMTCLVQAIYTHIHDLIGTGNLYTYTWPDWYRQFIHIYMTCLAQAIYTHIHDLFGTGNLYTYTWPVWYMQFIHIYITCLHKLPVPSRSCICAYIACTKQVMYICINCLYQAGDVYVYKLPVQSRWCICV